MKSCTGKSTTIRAVADLLPAIQVVADVINSSTTDFDNEESVKNAVEKNEEYQLVIKKCQWLIYSRATEDRVCGTIDIESINRRC